MSDALTDAEIAEIETYTNETTPLPWIASSSGAEVTHNDETTYAAWEVYRDLGEMEEPVLLAVGDRKVYDAFFAATARRDMPRLLQDLKKARELLRKVQFGTEGLCYLCFARKPALPDDHLPDCEVRTFLGPENKP